MPAPPPPPGPPPPPVAISSGPSTTAPPKDLLKSIHKGAKLKKVQTVDKSGPYIDGGQTKTTAAKSGGGRSPPMQRPGNEQPQMKGGLFAGGMPKLKSSGGPGGNGSSNQGLNNNNIQNPSPAGLALPSSGLAAALRARSASGGNVNTATYPPLNAAPPQATPRQNPVMMPPIRNANDGPPQIASKPFPAPSVPIRQVDQLSPRTSDYNPVRPANNAPPPVAARNLSTGHPPALLLKPNPALSPRTSQTNLNTSNGSMDHPAASPTNHYSATNHTSNSTTVQDGRWTFHTDIPTPRQWPSGDASSTNTLGSGPPAAKSRPPPPPPSRGISVVGKRPPPPPPGRG